METCIVGIPKGSPSKLLAQKALQGSIRPPASEPQLSGSGKPASPKPTAGSPQPPLPDSPTKDKVAVNFCARAIDQEADKEEPYESPEWDPRQLDLLGERLTASEERQLRDLEEQSELPGYMQKVDLLVASKLIAHGIATHKQLFRGKTLMAYHNSNSAIYWSDSHQEYGQ